MKLLFSSQFKSYTEQTSLDLTLNNAVYILNQWSVSVVRPQAADRKKKLDDGVLIKDKQHHKFSMMHKKKYRCNEDKSNATAIHLHKLGKFAISNWYRIERSDQNN